MAMRLLIFTVFFAGTCLAGDDGRSGDVLKRIKLPPGFVVSIYAGDAPGVRSMAPGGDGVVFAGTNSNGRVFAFKDEDGDGKADKKYLIDSGLYLPNGVAFRNGSLYVAEVNRILRYDGILRRLENPPEPAVVYDRFPSDRHHGWKYLRFGPDGRLYTAVGAPCNICDPVKKIYTSLISVDPEGKGYRILARGIRNTVGFDWHPDSGTLYFTENGRDRMGDDLPPDELNRLDKPGQHFGYPYCHAGDIPDPKFGKGKDCAAFAPPVWKFKAHMAPLGMRFYRGGKFPKGYRGQLFVAQHGSWNRSEPHGYRVALVRFEVGVPVSEQVFADGWLGEEGEVFGRPVDIVETAEGDLLVSDDHRGVIYRITYRGP
ncbi:MAG: PQQ-dependent sugar dehydrogenase [Gammaproteobacteria bacterium]